MEVIKMEEKKFTKLEIVYNAIFIPIMIIAVMILIPKVLSVFVNSLEMIIRLVKYGLVSSMDFGIFMLTGIWAIPLLLFVIILCIFGYALLVALTVFRIKKLKERKTKVYDFFYLIALYFYYAIIEGYYFEVKNIPYYFATIIEYCILVELVFLIAILLKHRRK